MFRLPFRLFSANWVSTVLDDFVPSATLFLKTYPPSKKTMIVTGPLGSGKSTAIDIAYASANESGKIDMLMTIPIGETLKEVKQPEDQEDEQETDQNEIDHMLVVNSVNQSVVQMLEFVNKKDVPDEINKEIVAVLKHYAKKLISLCEKIDKSLVDEPDAASFLEVRKEEKKIGIEILNDKLKEYKKVIKLTALEYSALSHIIENVTVPDAFDIVATGILSFRAEENFGELSTALTVNILNLVGKYCVSKQMACPILRIDDCHLMYHTPFTIDYFKLLIEEIVTSKAYFYTIIEGAGVFSDVLSLIVQYKDDFDWYNIKDNDFKNFVSGLDQEAPGLSEISKTNLWDNCYGNMQIFGAIVNSINIDKLSPEDVCQKIQESTLSTINTIFAEFEASPDELENVTSIEKMIGIDNLKQRAVAYFLYKLCNEQDQEITVELEEFAYNYIMTKLIIFRVLYYNTETKRLGFDKKFIADVLPHSEFWKYNHTWSDRLKNKLAYRKMTKNED